MKILIDTLDLEYIKKYSRLGVISGVTTNPTLYKNFKVNNIIEIIPKVREALGNSRDEIHVELLEDNIDNLTKKAEEIYKKSKEANLIFKIPFSQTALEFAYLKHYSYNINIHLIYSINQALLAAKTNVKYICPLFGRLNDIGTNAFEQIKVMKEAFRVNNESTKILLSSIRDPQTVIQAYNLGIDAVTIPPKVLDLMMEHPLTEKGIIQFKKDSINEF